MQREVDVVIATPGHSMEAEYVKSLVATISFLSANNISFHFANQYSSRVAAAREATAMDSNYLNAFSTEPFLGTIKYKKLFWIDSDISWSIDEFMRLVNSEKDIISGVYLSDRGVPMFSTLQDSEEKPMDILQYKEDREVFAVGFGFVCVKSGVFEKMKRPWFADKFSRMVDESTGNEVFVPYGEDFSWCISAREAGFRIYVDPSTRVAHHKKVRIYP